MILCDTKPKSNALDTFESHLVKPGMGERVENVFTEGQVNCKSFTVDFIRCGASDNPPIEKKAG